MSTIWWPRYCGNRTLYDALWSPELTVNTAVPDLTNCFQQAILAWAVYGTFTILGYCYLMYLTTKDNVHPRNAKRTFNRFKTVLYTALFAIQFLLLVLDILEDRDQDGGWLSIADYGAYTVKLFAMMLVLMLNVLEFRAGVASSAVFLFWVLATFIEAIRLYSSVVRWNNGDLYVGYHNYVLQTTYCALMLLSLLCGLKADLNALPGGLRTSSSTEKAECVPLLLRQDKHSKDSGDTPLSQSAGSTEMELCPAVEPCPLIRLPFWQKFTFFWIFKYAVRGYKKALVFTDLPDILPEDSTQELLPKFNKTYYTGRSAEPDGIRAHRNISVAVFLVVLPSFLLSALYSALTTCTSLLGPQILGLMINYLEGERQYLWQGVLLAVFLFANNCFTALFSNHLLHVCFLAGMRARSIVNAVVYRKALRLPSAARRLSNPGQVISLMSVDAQKIQDMFQNCMLIWSAPIVILISIYLLWLTVGLACIPGVLVLLIMFPINALYLARKIEQLQAEQMQQKDKRFSIMGEMLAGIKVLKFYAWEKPFLDKVSACREEELLKIRNTNYINVFSGVCWFLSPYLVSLAVFSTYVLSSPEHVLDAATAFVALTYINHLHVPISVLPLGLFSAAQGIVSTKRIQAFLDLKELPEDLAVRGSSVKDTAVKLDACTYSWNRTDEPTLNQIHLDIPRGSLVAVVGQQGCGKTSLINALIGEMHCVSGDAQVNGSLAYVPQQAWILNSKLRDNILFRKSFIPERFSSICDACALTPEFAILPGGDMTEIGEKGINLSGGQKQRVSLARAVYQNEDIYLLDDPLSAADAHVGKHIFTKVIGPDGLLKHKTRVFVTHGAGYLPHVDYIYTMKDGRISEAGRFTELVAKGGEFAKFLHTYVTEQDPETEEQVSELEHLMDIISGTDIDVISDIGKELETSIKKKKAEIRRQSISLPSTITKSGTKTEENEEKHRECRLVQDEASQTGKLHVKVLSDYTLAAGVVTSVTVVISIFTLIIFQVFTNIWLSRWTADSCISGDNDENRAQSTFRLSVYGVLGSFQLLFAMAASFALAHGCYRASRGLHNHLLQRILHAPMSFFYTTSLGRIMNHFFKDLDVIDMNMPTSLRRWFTALAPVAVTFCVLVYTYSLFIFLAIPLFLLFFILKRVYMNMGRQVKRIDSVSRSFIYSQLDETVNGVASIRAYKMEQDFLTKCERLINESQRSCFLLVTSQRWFGINMELVSNLVVIITALYAVLDDTLDASLAGLSLSYALTAALYTNQLIRQSTELETHVVSVERLQEYAHIENEADWLVPHHIAPRDWPSEGRIKFEFYGTRYRPGLEPVLRNVSLDIRAGEKIGIVGGTGAGKSSLSLGLFRITEPASGRILIDDVDISEIGLHDHRSRLSIIPQDPVIFSGSLRSNLDPFDEYSDDVIWDVLKSCHLLEFVRNLSEGLLYNCGENGASLSVGQRRLVCLGRALLRDSKILVLDEATAAVDLETDALIQCAIRTQFENCTILTAAHRISTVLDYDRIVVLDKGQIVELDTPTALLRDQRTIFNKMAKEAGMH